MLRRALLTSFSTLNSATGRDWKANAHDGEALWRKVANVVNTQQRLHKMVEVRFENNRERQRQASSKGQLPKFVKSELRQLRGAYFYNKLWLRGAELRVCRAFIRSNVLVPTSMSSLFCLRFGRNRALRMLSRACVMARKIQACCRGFQDPEI